MIQSYRRRLVFLAIGGLFVAVAAGHVLFAQATPQSAPRSTRSKDAKQADNAPGEARVVVQSSNPTAAYANFCRVTGTPEEVILDFGLNPQPFGVPTEPISVQQRTVLNFYTAKRMLAALETTIKRHEDAFGEIEVDVQKRVRAKE